MLRLAVPFVVLLGLCLTLPAASQALPPESDARLGLTYHESGVRQLSFAVYSEVADPDAMAEAVRTAFGLDAQSLKRFVDYNDIPFVAAARTQLERGSGLTFEEHFDFSPLQPLLAAAGAEHLEIVAFLPTSPTTQLGPLQGVRFTSAYRYENQVPVNALSTSWTIRYGWSYGQALTPLLWLIGLLILFEFPLSQVRRWALREARAGKHSAARVCAIIHQLSLVAFILYWCIFMGYTVPLPWLVYVSPKWYEWGLALALIVPTLLGIAYIVRVRTALHPVFQCLPDPTWTRRELALQGLFVGTLLVQAFPLTLLFLVGHAFLLPIDFDRISLYTFIAVQFVPHFLLLWGTYLYWSSRRLRTEVVKVGPLRNRLTVLAMRLEFQYAATLAVVHFRRYALAFPYLFQSLGGSILIDKRLLGILDEDALDALLTRDLLTSRGRGMFSSTALLAMYNLAALSILLGLVVVGIFPANDIGTTRFANPFFTASLVGLPMLAAIGGWLHVASIRRRKMDAIDSESIALLNSPTDLMRAILYEAHASLEPLEIWALSPFCVTHPPMTRLRTIAKAHNITNEELRTLQNEVANVWHTRPMEPEEPTSPLSTADLCLRDLISQVPIYTALSLMPVLLAWWQEAYSHALPAYWVFALTSSTMLAVLIILYQERISCAGLWWAGKRLAERFPRSASDYDTTILAAFKWDDGLDPNYLSSTNSHGELRIAEGKLILACNQIDYEISPQDVQSISMVPDWMSPTSRYLIRLEWVEPETKESRSVHILRLGDSSLYTLNNATMDTYGQLLNWHSQSGFTAPRRNDDIPRNRIANILRSQMSFTLAMILAYAASILFLGYANHEASAFMTPAAAWSAIFIFGLTMLYVVGWNFHIRRSIARRVATLTAEAPSATSP